MISRPTIYNLKPLQLQIEDFPFLMRILDSLKVRQKVGGCGVIWVRQAN